MLCLIFHAGGDRFAMATREVAGVLPLVELHRVGHSPDWLAGLFDYRGTITPVLDLPHMLRGADCPRRLSTRIVLVNYPVRGVTARPLGLLRRLNSVACKRDGHL